LNNVDVLPQWFGVTVTGGRLNTYQALVNGSFNVSPTVTLTSPTNGAAFTAPATITITANAHDSDGSVARGGFYANGSLIGSAVASPFTFTWTKVAARAYTLTAVATDNHGAPKTSAPVSVSVNPDPSRVNVAAAAAGATAVASSTYSGPPALPASGAIDGDHKNWAAGEGWNDNTLGIYPDWL